MRIEEALRKLHALAGGRYCSLSVDFRTYHHENQPTTIFQAYIEDVGTTGEQESLELAMAQIEASVMEKDEKTPAPESAEARAGELDALLDEKGTAA